MGKMPEWVRGLPLRADGYGCAFKKMSSWVETGMNSPVITTGNELVKQEIADFSEQLDLDELYSYLSDVKRSTESILRDLSYDDLRKKISAERKERLESLSVVSKEESAIWLIDYWCNKDIRGLIQMPFSRHWIMHIEACLRIKKKIHP
jgi:hypothetical protein